MPSTRAISSINQANSMVSLHPEHRPLNRPALSAELKKIFRNGLILAVTGLLFSLLPGGPAPAQAGQTERLLIPIGGGYADIYAGFSAQAVRNARDGRVRILVLPTAYASNPQSITQAERQKNLSDAEERRFQIEEACKRAASELKRSSSCTAQLLPVFTRSDAADPSALTAFEPAPSAVFILGGDQTIAMQALAGSPIEQALTETYRRGTVVAGTSAGGGMLSATMLAGYQLNFAQANSLADGAVDVWNSAGRRGLPFGIPQAVLDQHFYQRSRPGRLLNAISLPQVPHIGIGIDAYTGAIIRSERKLGEVFGLYTVTVLDAASYAAADTAQKRGENRLLSLRNVLVHLLSPGKFSYDLQTRRHSLAAPPARLKRTFDSLALPPRAGALWLSSGLAENPSATVLRRFAELAGGSRAHLLIVAVGYPSPTSARRAAQALAATLNVTTTLVTLQTESTIPLALPETISGMILIGKDASDLPVTALAPLKTAWAAGLPLLADGAGAAVVGAFYSPHPPTPQDSEAAEAATQKSFLKGRTRVQPGLGLLPVSIEYHLLEDNRWGRFFSLACAHPKLLTLGLNNGSRVEILPGSRQAGGENDLLVLDLRPATLALGENDGYVIANGLLDVFAPGDSLLPRAAELIPIEGRDGLNRTKVAKISRK